MNSLLTKPSLAENDQFNIIKKKLLSEGDVYSFVSPSAYDTAWLAMIPDYRKSMSEPLFKSCLNWVLNNQNEEGFWGDCIAFGNPFIECLPATLACIAALKMWNVGHANIEKGLAFIQTNAEKHIRNMDNCPRWFAIVFSGMIELTNTLDIQIVLPESLQEVMRNIYCSRQCILEKEELVDRVSYPPLLSYLEALPSSFIIEKEDIIQHLSSDGSLFQSPSATAYAYMVTRKNECMAYLQSLVQRCPGGVPATYPMDEEFIKLSMIDQIQRLGLAAHFKEESKQILAQVYRNYTNQDGAEKTLHSFARDLYKDTLAFWLLRMHGYSISPGIFCWFLQHEEILNYLGENHEFFSSLTLDIFRATDTMFPGEYELQEARSFSSKLLEKTLDAGTTYKNFHKMIKQELRTPWYAQMDHLEHRKWIEERDINALWIGKATPFRLSCRYNKKLVELAIQNYEFRQSVYRKELEEVKRWSKQTGLTSMGFGREKTTYCYFAIACSNSLPCDSEVRMIVAKSAILITVADDFFDSKGSINELESLTNAVERWDAKGLDGHSKIIFNVLYDLVRGHAEKYHEKNGIDIANDLRNIWFEAFNAWLTEVKWARSGFCPSMDEYLQVGMVSIGAHTLVLIAQCFLNENLPSLPVRPSQYEPITKLLMVSTRLLNDLHSYQKELVEGAPNSILLYMKENPQANMDEAVAYVKEILNKNKKQFIECVLKDGLSNMPKPYKDLHLSCFKVFHMFFNASNRYDSDTEMLEDIAKAIYTSLDIPTWQKPHVPLDVPTLKKLKPLVPLSISTSKIPQQEGVPCSRATEAVARVNMCYFEGENKRFNIRSSMSPHISYLIPKKQYGHTFTQLNLKFCSI